MNMQYGNVVLITGASSGIGKAIGNALTNQGYKVYGTSRNAKAETYNEIILPTDNCDGFLRMIQLDVRSEESARKAVDIVLKEEGRIDILINNAGIGIAGSVEDTTVEESYKQFDTNFFGVLRMCRTVIPVMRSNKKGLIINISSVAGLIAIPFQSMYSSSKYAVEALTEALRIEVKPFGINVSMVEPGDTKTGFTEKRLYAAGANKDSAYSAKFEKSINAMVESELNGPGPIKIVQAVIRIINMKNPPIRITAGFSYKVIVLLKRILPARFVSYIVSKIY